MIAVERRICAAFLICILRQAPGSGKTLAYLVPLLQMLQHQWTGPSSQKPGSRRSRDPPSPKAVILAPTRELANQIAVQAQQLLGVMEIRVACIYGGVPYRSSNSSCFEKTSTVIFFWGGSRPIWYVKTKVEIPNSGFPRYSHIW